ncbi:uncharacterized protein F5891DRAFT_980263 [Suillus fuscotomentosus]|uniref:Uncharacterized protein n=1 Tax=Suillus fuscotomentosus TaxID=1912939 RepID=A0AAD4HMA9_9AGAM|nr:uncharacterized protein F5891DRAFT_980263 [Suillus fuscotomentosus]KAG1900689.1 hypothetical protein F5891DRAFT_980263 [Suillus fuscotomentosus]
MIMLMLLNPGPSPLFAQLVTPNIPASSSEKENLGDIKELLPDGRVHCTIMVLGLWEGLHADVFVLVVESLTRWSARCVSIWSKDMVKKDFIGRGPYPTYILPSSSRTTPPPTTNPFLPPPAALAPNIATYLMCMARLQAMGQAKPGLNRPSRAEPKSWPGDSFGLAWEYERPKPLAQASAYTFRSLTLCACSCGKNHMLADSTLIIFSNMPSFASFLQLQIASLATTITYVFRQKACICDDSDDKCCAHRPVRQTKPTATLLQHSEKAALPSQTKAINAFHAAEAAKLPDSRHASNAGADQTTPSISLNSPPGDTAPSGSSLAALEKGKRTRVQEILDNESGADNDGIPINVNVQPIADTAPTHESKTADLNELMARFKSIESARYVLLGLQLRPSQAKAKPSLTALAWPAVFESQGRLKPGRSRGFQAKPGRVFQWIVNVIISPLRHHTARSTHHHPSLWLLYYTGPTIPTHPSPFQNTQSVSHLRMGYHPEPSAPPNKPQSTQPMTRHSDPFYGHEQVSQLFDRFIMHLFACPEYPPSSSVTFTALVLLQQLKPHKPSTYHKSLPASSSHFGPHTFAFIWPSPPTPPGMEDCIPKHEPVPVPPPSKHNLQVLPTMLLLNTFAMNQLL